MNRFIVRAMVISLGAAVLWWATAGWGRAGSIAVAKGLHAIVGYPAPFLLADLDDYYWFAPMFPPLVGLILASHWISLRRRVVVLACGLVAFAYLVGLQIAVVYSPYLTLSAVRAYVMSTQVALNSVAVPVVFWLIGTGGPPRDWDSAEVRSSGGMRLVVLLMAGCCGLMTLPVLLAVRESTPTLTAARGSLARALSSDQPRSAIRSIDVMLSTQRSNAALSYLQLCLLDRMGDEGAADRVRSEALTTRERRLAYRRGAN